MRLARTKDFAYRAASEAVIQSSCVQWMWNEHPETRGLYCAIPNENTLTVLENREKRAITGARRLSMGVVAGVADTVLLIPKRGYHGFFIEFKKETGKQSESQKRWETLVTAQGYLYAVIRNLEEFKYAVEKYLNEEDIWI